MGVPNRIDGDAKTASFSLPPGCRFYPSEEQLLCYYLTKKNTITEEENNLCGDDLIKELDLYEYAPFNLPEKACYAYGRGGRKRHWYCYSRARVEKESKCRKAKSGYWRRRGTVRDVVVRNSNNNKRGKLVLGTRTSFVFYLGNSLENAIRTDWVMHEYALVDHVEASFVRSRLFIKSSDGNSIPEVSLASAAGKSVSAVCHIGVQHDGFLILDSSEDGHVISMPVSDARFLFPAGVPSNEQVSAYGLTGAGLFIDAVAAMQFPSILEGDFIELNDLVP